MAKQKKVEVGQIVKVTNCTNSHNYNIGETYRVLEVNSNTCVCAKLENPTWIGNQLSFHDLEILFLDKKYFQEANKKLKSEISENEDIIKWMEESGNTTYNPNEHKVWRTLTMLENDKMSKSEKAKIIASLIK